MASARAGDSDRRKQSSQGFEALAIGHREAPERFDRARLRFRLIRPRDFGDERTQLVDIADRPVSQIDLCDLAVAIARARERRQDPRPRVGVSEAGEHRDVGKTPGLRARKLHGLERQRLIGGIERTDESHFGGVDRVAGDVVVDHPADLGCGARRP